GVRIADAPGHPLAPDADVRAGTIARRRVVREARTRRLHAQGAIELVGGQVLPGLPGRPRGGDRRGGVAEVRVRVPRTTAAGRLKVAQPVQDLRTVVAQVLQQVAPVFRKAGPVAEQVAERDLTR